MVIKELVDDAPAMSNLFEEPIEVATAVLAASDADGAADTKPEDEGTGENADDGAAAPQPEGAAAAEPASVEDEAEGESSDKPVTGPQEGETEGMGAEGGEVLAQTGETDGDGADVLDETNASEMRDSAPLPASTQTEVTRLIARLLPLDEVDAADWTAAAYFVKHADVSDSAPLDMRFHVGVLPIAPISKLSQVITKAYMPVIHRASDSSPGLLGM